MPRSLSPHDKERKSRDLAKKSKRDRRKRSTSSDSSRSSSASGRRHKNRSRSSRKRSSSSKEGRKRKHSSSSSSSPSPSRKKKQKKEKKEKRKKKKEKKKSKKKEKEKQRKLSSEGADSAKAQPEIPKSSTGSAASVGPKPRVMKPMTKEEWEKQQSVMRHVYDEESGRTRLIKGDGEVMEEIVSKERHREINKTSTQGDGRFFASKMGLL
ncbi:hypothetical protein BaRGS_00033725 [Batillaria attramentaria]|uniref:ADP-ribosylation factor-like protein 6-interacting protein 4 n=1 Tax=Batillaria attramentaria TaxID=370345 RepID=A0ABD0JJA1_9CAEN